MKARVGYPKKPFENLSAAQAWVDNFVRWYNQGHRDRDAEHGLATSATVDERLPVTLNPSKTRNEIDQAA